MYVCKVRNCMMNVAAVVIVVRTKYLLVILKSRAYQTFVYIISIFKWTRAKRCTYGTCEHRPFMPSGNHSLKADGCHCQIPFSVCHPSLCFSAIGIVVFDAIVVYRHRCDVSMYLIVLHILLEYIVRCESVVVKHNASVRVFLLTIIPFHTLCKFLSSFFFASLYVQDMCYL